MTSLNNTIAMHAPAGSTDMATSNALYGNRWRAIFAAGNILTGQDRGTRIVSRHSQKVNHF
jgi:hypothetical protein